MVGSNPFCLPAKNQHVVFHLVGKLVHMIDGFGGTLDHIKTQLRLISGAYGQSCGFRSVSGNLRTDGVKLVHSVYGLFNPVSLNFHALLGVLYLAGKYVYNIAKGNNCFIYGLRRQMQAFAHNGQYNATRLQ